MKLSGEARSTRIVLRDYPLCHVFYEIIHCARCFPRLPITESSKHSRVCDKGDSHTRDWLVLHSVHSLNILYMICSILLVRCYLDSNISLTYMLSERF